MKTTKEIVTLFKKLNKRRKQVNIHLAQRPELNTRTRLLLRHMTIFKIQERILNHYLKYLFGYEIILAFNDHEYMPARFRIIKKQKEIRL